MKVRSRYCASVGSIVSKLDRACRVLRWAVPPAAGGLIFCPMALGQTYDANISDIQITHTAGIGASGSLFNSPYTTIDVPGTTTAPVSPFGKYVTPAGETLAPHTIYVGTPPTSAYQLKSIVTGSAPTGPASSTAYANVGESGGGGGNTDLVLGSGTGVTQTNPGGIYPYASELTVNVKNLAYSVAKLPTTPFGFPTLTYAFPVGGSLPVGGTVNFNVDLTYLYYPSALPASTFTFASSTPQTVGTISISETFTNTGSAVMAFTNTNAGALLLNGGVALPSAGYLDVVGTVSFSAIVDSPPANGATGSGSVHVQNTGGSNSWSPAPSPSSFELYLTAPATILPGTGPGNTFLETGSSSLSTAASWTDTTAATAGPPLANDIALFAAGSTGGVYNLNTATNWGGLSELNPKAPVIIASGQGGSALNLGAFGITLGADTLGHAQNLTIAAPVSTTASQTWSVVGGQTLSLNGTSLNLGASTVSIVGGGNVNISSSIGGAGGLVMGGGGTVALSGINNYTGGTILNSGEVSISSDSNIGGSGGGITFNGGILQITGTSLQNIHSHAVNWNSFSGGFDIADPGNVFTINDAIGNAALNSGSLTKNGAGQLDILVPANYAGPTIINGGSIFLLTGDCLNPLSTVVINTPQGLFLNNDVSLSNSIVNNVSSGEFVKVSSGLGFGSLDGSITTGAGAQYNLGFPNAQFELEITGPNTSAANQPATISEGTILFAFNPDSGLTGALSVNANGANTLVLGNGAAPLGLTLQDNSSITNIGNGGATLETQIQNLNNGTPAPGAMVAIQDQASLNLGTGIFNVNASSNPAGFTEVDLNGGTLSTGGISFTPMSNPGGIPTTIIRFNGGVLTAAASNTDFIPFGVGGDLELHVESGGAVFNSNGFDITLNSVSGFKVSAPNDGGIIKNGAGALILGPTFADGGSSQTSGGLKINGGLVEYSDANQSLIGTTSIQPGGAVGSDDGTLQNPFIGQLLNYLTTNSGSLALSANDANAVIDYTGNVAGAFNMTAPMPGSPISLSNMSIGAVSGGVTFTGSIVPGMVSGSPTYPLGGGGMLTFPSSNPLVDSNGTPTNVLIENGGTVAVPSNDTYTGSTTILGAMVLTVPAADSLTGADQFQLEQTTLRVSSLANGVNSLGAGSHSVAGNLILNGGILQYMGSGDSSPVAFTIGQMGATLDSSGSGAWQLQNGVAAQAYSQGFTGPVTLTLTGSNANANQLNSRLTDGAGITLGLVKSGSGLWILGAGNSYHGATTINGGTLRLGAATSLGTTSGVIINSGSLDLNGQPVAIKNLSGAGAIINSSAAAANLTINGVGNSPFSGNISGTIGLVKSGGGTLTLSGSNTYTGQTTVLGGELSISNDVNISGNIVINGGTLQIAGTALANLNNHTVNWAGFNGGLDIADPLSIFTVSQNITGGGSLTKYGAGTLVLTGTNTYNGGTNIVAGTVIVPDISALGTGPLTNNGALIFTSSNGNTLSSNQSGAGGITATGPLTLTGSNSYTGLTTVNFGATLTLAASNALPAGGQVQNFGLLVVKSPTVAGTIAGDGITTVNVGTTLYTDGFVQGGLVNNGTTTIGCGGTSGLISGNGTLTVGSPVMVGDLQLAPGVGNSQQSGLTIVGTSTVDITNNSVAINFGPGPDPVNTLLAYLNTGYNSGTWTGTGLTSSLAAANPGKFAVGYADGSRPRDSIAGVPNGQVLVKFTLAGDANLNGTVDFADLVSLAQNFGFTGRDWVQGNFNYSAAGTVGFADLVVLAQNFGFTAASGNPGGISVSPAWQAVDPLVAGTTAIPEPGSFALALAVGAGIIGRRRRSKIHGF